MGIGYNGGGKCAIERRAGRTKDCIVSSNVYRLCVDIVELEIEETS